MSIVDDVTAVLASVPELAKVLEAAKPLLAEVEAALPTVDRAEFEDAFSAAMSILASLAHPNPDMVAKLKNRAGNAIGRLGRFAEHFTSDAGHFVNDAAKDVQELVSDDPTQAQAVVVTPDAPAPVVTATAPVEVKPEPPRVV